jgi:hypothetical protein
MANLTPRQFTAYTMVRDVIQQAEDDVDDDLGGPLHSKARIRSWVQGHPDYSRYLKPAPIGRGRHRKTRPGITESYITRLCALSLHSQVQPIGYVPGYGYSARPLLVREGRDGMLKATTKGCDKQRADNIEQAKALDRGLGRKLLKGLGTSEFDDPLREQRAEARQLLPASSQEQLAAQLVTDAARLKQPQGVTGPASAATTNGG